MPDLPPVTIPLFYEYTPVGGILIAACVLFGLQTLIVLAQVVRSRAWLMLWVALFLAGECGGYIAFSFFVYQPDITSYLAQLIDLACAPQIVNLVNYVVVTKIVRYCAATGNVNRSSLPTRLLSRYCHWLPPVMFLLDFMCLTLQGVGGSQLSMAVREGVFKPSNYNLGRALSLAGIAGILGLTAIFLAVCTYVYRRMCSPQLNIRLRYTWLCVALTMTLVTIRNIYRIVEYEGWQYGAVNQTEVPWDIFDLLNMLICGAVFIVLDLGRNDIFPVDIRNNEVALPTRHEKLLEEKTADGYTNIHSPTAELRTTGSEAMA